MKDAKKKVAAKVGKAKAKVADKVKKVGKKVKAVAVVIGLMVVACGCQNPAQRAQTADTRITIWGGNVTFGSEFVSLAQANETGGNDAGQIATPTNDIKPDVDIAVPVNKAGAAQSVGSTIGDAVASLINGTKASTTSSGASTETSGTACTDGSCTP